ncbi:MAG: glycosyltransferase family 2 protein [Sphingobacteriales bacterium]
MAAVVLDLQIDPVPEFISGLEAYDKAYVVFRFGNIPVSGLWFDVEAGKLELHKYVSNILKASEGGLTDVLIRREKEGDLNPADYPSASIAVCTRNRTDDLKRGLESLLSLSGPRQEILVIDNAPSDSSTQNLIQNYFPAVKYILESTAGLDIARNRAVQEASNDIVVFIDDDAIADRFWLREILKPFIRERVVCVTGMTQPLELLHEGQEAFERYSPFCKGYVRRVYDTSHNPLTTGGIGAGVNMAIRKNIVHKIGWFDESLDAGTPTQSGGDHEYFTRILRSGYYIAYQPSALNWHRHRRTMDDTRKAIYGYGVGMYAYWTKLLIKDREWWVLKQAFQWFYSHQLRHLLKSLLKRGDHFPLTLVWAEWQGCFKGPSSYFSSLKKQKLRHAASKNIRRHSYA